MNKKDPERYAPKGYVWQCQACGKICKTADRYDGHGERHWDVSCVLNSILVKEKDANSNS